MSSSTLSGLSKFTTSTAGNLFETSVPGLAGYESRKITFEVLRDAINSVVITNKGWFTSETALETAYPVGEGGWFAIVADPDPTVYVWNVSLAAWDDTESDGLVLSVNGLTGAVVLTGANIDYSSTVGLSATNISAAVDELKTYIDAELAGTASGIYKLDVRTGSDEAYTSGSNTITFEEPFLDTNYTVVVSDDSGNGIKKDDITKLTTGFQIPGLEPGSLSYVAIHNNATFTSLTDTNAIHKTINGEINSLTEKVTPVTGDLVIIEDSEDSYSKKKVNVNNLPGSGGSARFVDTFVSGDLVSGVLSVNHALSSQYPSSIVVYDDNDNEVSKTNYIYNAADANNGNITFYLPITNTWTIVISL